MLCIKLITSPDVNRFKVKSLTYFPIIIRFVSLRPDFGVYTGAIASHIYSYVIFKNKLIVFSFVALMMHHLMHCLWKTNTARNLVLRERYIATISRTAF